MKLRVLSTAEAEATDAACWYDDQSIGLGELFLAEYAAALSAIKVALLIESVSWRRNRRADSDGAFSCDSLTL